MYYLEGRYNMPKITQLPTDDVANPNDLLIVEDSGTNLTSKLLFSDFKISGVNVNDNAITTDKIANNTVNTSDIASTGIKSEKLKPIEFYKIGNGLTPSTGAKEYIAGSTTTFTVTVPSIMILDVHSNIQNNGSGGGATNTAVIYVRIDGTDRYNISFENAWLPIFTTSTDGSFVYDLTVGSHTVELWGYNNRTVASVIWEPSYSFMVFAK
jgi:hypothetical protein